MQEQREREQIVQGNQYLRPEVDQKKGTRLTGDQLILFLACVIKCTDQAKNKTEEIKIIVKEVEKVLGVKDVSWEQINERLEVDGSPGSAEESTS